MRLGRLNCFFFKFNQSLVWFYLFYIKFSLFFHIAELGDYIPEEHGAGYLSRLQLVPGQTEEMEKKIAELHKLHKYESFTKKIFSYE